MAYQWQPKTRKINESILREIGLGRNYAYTVSKNAKLARSTVQKKLPQLESLNLITFDKIEVVENRPRRCYRLAFKGAIIALNATDVDCELLQICRNVKSFFLFNLSCCFDAEGFRELALWFLKTIREGWTIFRFDNLTDDELKVMLYGYIQMKSTSLPEELRQHEFVKRMILGYSFIDMFFTFTEKAANNTLEKDYGLKMLRKTFEVAETYLPMSDSRYKWLKRLLFWALRKPTQADSNAN